MNESMKILNNMVYVGHHYTQTYLYVYMDICIYVCLDVLSENIIYTVKICTPLY